ncbi:integrase arm-type DNA-binding domain-containing protein [Sphingosinicellaceae bacterium]|nr:integrase arm-type DNA-binding domain-containing protein [Sphingosinicellaceae bacterium]
MLTVTAIRAAKTTTRKIRLFDSGGLYLEVTTTGAKYWRLKYRFGGAERLAAFGVYPEVSLPEARARRDAARALLRDGLDPNTVKRSRAAEQATADAAAIAAQETFGTVRKAWLADFQAREHLPRGGGRIAAITSRTAKFHLDKAASLDGKPIATITATEIIAVIKPLEQAGLLETAKRVRQRLGDVFAYAVRRGLRAYNPMGDLKSEFLPPSPRNHPAIIDADRLGGLLRACWNYQGQPSVTAALKLAALAFVRPSELRGALWSEFDLDAALWVIPSERMNGGRHDHLIPLPTQAVAILRELRDLTGDDCTFLFPSIRTAQRCMSENTINSALRSMGYSKEEMTGHGFRTIASTILNENNFPSDYIERQLGHINKDGVRGAYNRALWLSQRRLMVQWLADHYDHLRSSIGLDVLTKDG